MSKHGPLSLSSNQVTVLDHGYLKYIEHWGSDAAIVETARMSTNKGFLGWEPEYVYGCPRCSYTTICSEPNDILHCPNVDCGDGLVKHLELRSSHKGDQKLLAYLYQHRHMTPFEFAGLTIEVQLPLFVRSEWERHRTQAYNEMSSRYVEMEPLWYTPSAERLLCGFQDSKNRQGSCQKVYDTDTEAESARLLVDQWASRMSEQCRSAFRTYSILLNAGMARELARGVLPVNTYTRLRATAKLRNWLEFMTLREDPAAQWEIRQYALELGRLLELIFPRTFYLWKEEKYGKEKS